MFEKYIHILNKVILFSNISPDELSGMLQCLNPSVKTHKKNEYIAIEGDKCKGIGVVLSGKAIISKENASGNRVMLSVLNPGEIFGEIIAFSNQFTWPASVISQDECEIMFLPREKIIGQCEKVCSWHRTLITNLLGITSQRALMLNKKVEYLTIKSIRGKISTFLLDLYKKTQKNNVMLNMNRNELADFLNVSRPSMSREMCRMRDEGIIDFHLSAIRIKDVEALKEGCDQK